MFFIITRWLVKASVYAVCFACLQWYFRREMRLFHFTPAIGLLSQPIYSWVDHHISAVEISSSHLPMLLCYWPCLASFVQFWYSCFYYSVRLGRYILRTNWTQLRALDYSIESGWNKSGGWNLLCFRSRISYTALGQNHTMWSDVPISSDPSCGLC